MKKLLTVLLAITVVSALSNAEDKQKETTTLDQHVHAIAPERLNNVIQLDTDGHRTALCGCGKQFEVTANSPAVQHGNETIYCCGDACHSSFAGMPAADQDKLISDLNSKLPAENLISNAIEKDGKTVATCLCGKEFEVTDRTPEVTENGVTLDLCGEACAAGLHKMSAEDRLEAELNLVASKENRHEAKR